MANLDSDKSTSVIYDSQSPDISSSSDNLRRKAVGKEVEPVKPADVHAAELVTNSLQVTASRGDATPRKYDDAKLQSVLRAAERGDRLSTATTVSDLDVSRDVQTPTRPAMWRSTLNQRESAARISVRQSVALRGVLDEEAEQSLEESSPCDGRFLQFDYLESNMVSAHYVEKVSGRRVDKNREFTVSEKRRVEMPNVIRQVARNGVTLGFRELADPLAAARKYDPHGFREVYLNAALNGESLLRAVADPLRGWFAQHEAAYLAEDQPESRHMKVRRAMPSQVSNCDLTCRSQVKSLHLLLKFVIFFYFLTH